jgi:lipoyl(octanoyl) transferase
MEVIGLGRADFAQTYAAMQAYTERRGHEPDLPDQIWLCEHPPTYTQGIAGKPEHILRSTDVAVVKTDRGGQVTYHGPGQAIAYPLIDLRRAGYFVKEYVYRIEEAVIRTLLHFGVTGHRVAGAPGIYVRLDDPFGHGRLSQRPVSAGPAQIAAMPDFAGLGKIAALGIKVSRHCTYHGVALNVAMDLEPFSHINPCGYARLKTVDLSTIDVQASLEDVAPVLGDKLARYLSP